MSQRLKRYLIEVKEARKAVDSLKAEREVVGKELEKKDSSVKKKAKLLESLVTAQWILTVVAEKTQKDFKGHVEALVTKAISPVFGRPYKFILDYGMRGRRASAQPLVQEGNSEPQVPKEDMGASILDVISFANRVVLWSLESPRSRNVVWMD